MKLREYEGKELFRKYGIATPNGEVVTRDNVSGVAIGVPAVLKAQVLSGDRNKHGGIMFVEQQKDLLLTLRNFFTKEVQDEIVETVLVEEKVPVAAEYYVSISYDTSVRGPVISLSKDGGSGISKAKIYPIDALMTQIPGFMMREILTSAGFDFADVPEFSKMIQNLWKLFLAEHALLAEINPVFKTTDGKFIAGDAKVILDDEKVNPTERRFVSMGGDIAILASGGGASMLNMDSLLFYGGKPANYTEYSGNPKAEVVKELTKRVLGQDGISGLWVIGGTANFTDIYETMSGFIEGLESLDKKPTYPIMIRRDGPRQKEAGDMLVQFAKSKGYDMHVYGRELPMEQSAKMIVELAGEYKKRMSKA